MENVRPFQCREDIRKEAQAWVLKFNLDTPPTNADVLALRNWASRSSVHRAELERAQTFWCDADSLSELAVPLCRQSKKSKPVALRAVVESLIAAIRRGLTNNPASAVFAVLFLGLSITLSSLYLPITGTVGNGVFRTTVGEQKTLILRDDSQIQLDTYSQVRVDYSEGRRQIYLQHGKAYFKVSENAERPFEVYAGTGMVRAVGTAFSVYLDDQDVKVIVDDGRVALARVDQQEKSFTKEGPVTDKTSVRRNVASNPAGAESNTAVVDLEPRIGEIFLTLDKGQSAVFNQNSEALSVLAENELSRDLAWRRGLLIFAGDPLSKVVSEVSRYTSTTIEIADPELRSLMIGGRFKVGELEALLDVLGAGFGVQISYVDNDHIKLHSAQQ